jgi:hypothetical protein
LREITYPWSGVSSELATGNPTAGQARHRRRTDGVGDAMTLTTGWIAEPTPLWAWSPPG